MAKTEGWGGYWFRKEPYTHLGHGKCLMFDEGDGAFTVWRKEVTKWHDFEDAFALVRDEDLADVLMNVLAPGHDHHESGTWYGPYDKGELYDEAEGATT